jgi:peptidyl-prolyl cis-trans isomerase C
MKSPLPTWFAPLPVVLLLLLTAALPSLAGETVALVNKVPISLDSYNQCWPPFLKQKGIAPGQSGTKENGGGLKRVLIDWLIDQELLFQEARETGYLAGSGSVDEELERILRPFKSQEGFASTLSRNNFTLEQYREFLRRRLTVENFLKNEIAGTVEVTNEEVDAYYNVHLDRFRTPEQVRVRHIMVRVPHDAGTAEREAARKRIEEILRAHQDGADFNELARKHSDCSSSIKGGDLGFFARGKMSPSFEERAFSLQAGSVSGIVETPFGYHVIKVEERREAARVPPEEVAATLREYLREIKVDEAVEERLQSLRDRASVEITQQF